MEESKTGICHIAGAGDFHGFFQKNIGENDFIIAADGGLNYLSEAGIKPHMFMGDMDSVNPVNFPDEQMLFPSEKDDTDMMIAVKHGLELGYKRFYLYGVTGGRISHTIANIQTLAYISQNNADGYMFGANTILTAITDSKIEFKRETEGMISVFSHGNRAEEIYIKGLKYPVNGDNFSNTFPRGVSNEFAGRESSISVKNGTLIIVIEHEFENPCEYLLNQI